MRPSILDILGADGHDLKKAANTNGGEYSGACPWCGGKDRFRVWPESEKNNYWCRQCSRSGDIIQYLREFRGMSYAEACLFIGKDSTFRKHSVMPRTLSKPTFTPRNPISPGSMWKRSAKKFLDTCQQYLWSQYGEVVRSFLYGKGLSDNIIKNAGIGWNESDIFLEREDWGLPSMLNEKKNLKKLWLPLGLVIPCFLDDEIVRLRIRRPAQNDEPRYIVTAGSDMRNMIWNPDNKYIVIVESELDGLLLLQEAGDLVGVIAMGSAQAKPDVRAHESLIKTEKILVSLDTDAAGARAAWHFWPKLYGDKVIRWPCVRGKDPSEAWQNGLDIRAWISTGISLN